MKRLISVILVLTFCSLMTTVTMRGRQEESAAPEAEAVMLVAERPQLAAEVFVPKPTPTPEPQYFSISFVGDCTFSSGAYNTGLASSYNNVIGDNYAYPFEKTVHLLNDDDFTLANLECALTNHKTAAIKSFVFRAVPEYAKILTEGSVEFATLGNNHVEDYGQQGYEDTKAALDAEGIAYAGLDEWSLYDANGLIIGVYAMSFGNTAQIEAGVRALREAGAELVIAALHWGDEGSYRANGIQVTQGRAAIDAGADIVYGSHPHVLQPVEEYNGKYIFYSMGNWSFGGNTNPRDKDTAIARLEITKDAVGVYVTELKLIPCAISGEGIGNNFQPVPREEDSEEYRRTLSKLDGSFTGPNLSINYEYSFSEY